MVKLRLTRRAAVVKNESEVKSLWRENCLHYCSVLMGTRLRELTDVQADVAFKETLRAEPYGVRTVNVNRNEYKCKTWSYSITCNVELIRHPYTSRICWWIPTFCLCFREPLWNMWSLFISWALFLLPNVRTSSPVWPIVGCWMSNCGRLWCCQREGRAPLLSECVMQEPLPWMRENIPDWCLKARGFVLNVGGWWWDISESKCNVIIFTKYSVKDLFKCYIKVILCDWRSSVQNYDSVIYFHFF